MGTSTLKEIGLGTITLAIIFLNAIRLYSKEVRVTTTNLAIYVCIHIDGHLDLWRDREGLRRVGQIHLQRSWNGHHRLSYIEIRLTTSTSNEPLREQCIDELRKPPHV